MATEGQLLTKYAEASPEARVRLIIKNYENFITAVEVCEEKLNRTIQAEISYARRQEKGDLGVRVQSNGIPGNPTENEAIQHMDIQDAIRRGYLTDSMLVDMECAARHQQEARTLRIMRLDYDAFNLQLKAMAKKDYEIIHPLFTREKSLGDIAEENGLCYESAKNKVYRIRKAFIKDAADLLIKV
ncbi:MAG: hypothetical protein HUJ70_02075, partial [Pseudobutyrivibrio sp.]|nr:hypothetical protein [Pseudobutyrivibrio sp.]